MKTIFLSLFLIAVFSCSRNTANDSTSQDVLPAATTSGANTAGCLVNGKVLIPKNGSQSIGGQPLYGLKEFCGNNFYPGMNDFWQLEISNKKDSNGYSIFLWINNMSAGPGNYIVNQSNGLLYEEGPNNNQIILISPDGKKYLSSSNSGNIFVSRSEVTSSTNIISGTFSCKVYNIENSSDIINVTDGRFDINYTTLNH